MNIFYYETKYPQIAGNPKPHLMGYRITRHYIDSLVDTSINDEELVGYEYLDEPKPLKNWHNEPKKEKVYLYCNGKKLKYTLDYIDSLRFDENWEEIDNIYFELERKKILN